VTAVAGLPLLSSYGLWRTRRRTLPLVVAVAGLATAFVIAVVLIAHDYRDADGWVDCWPHCSTLQTGVGVAFIWGGALLVVAGLVSLGALAVVAVRHRAAQGGR
jgi:hypothetical protein